MLMFSPKKPQVSAYIKEQQALIEKTLGLQLEIAPSDNQPPIFADGTFAEFQLK